MSSKSQITVAAKQMPRLALGILLAVFGFGVFLVGVDQGHMFSLIQGASAFDDLYLHELYHDMRHAAGYPCH